MVLNVHDSDVGLTEADDTGERCSRGESAQDYTDINRVNNIRSNGEITNKPSENENEAPLDFSIRRDAEKHSNADDSMTRHDDVTAQLSPISSEAGSSGRRSPDLVSDSHRMTSSYHPKLGDTRIPLPGLLPITSIANGGGLGFPMGFPPGFPAHLGMMGPLPPLVIDPKASESKPETEKNSRLFKTHPNDAMNLPLGYFGMPGAPPMPGLDLVKMHSLSQGMSEEMLKRYQEYFKTLQETQKRLRPPSPKPPRGPTQISKTQHNGSTPYLSPKQPSRGDSPPEVYSPHSSTNPSNLTLDPCHQSDIDGAYSTGLDNSTSQSRKRGRSLPEDSKDAAYWERRRKNNEAAKRSRDARRAKEDEIAIRAAFLEQENLKLRVEVAALKTETSKLRCMLYNS